MATLAAIEKQIAALQKTAAAMRKADLSAVAAKVKALIAQHGLSADDLGLAGKAAGKPAGKVKPVATRRKSPAAKPAGIPKYQDPASGKTWTGVGKPPAWIAGAKQREAFLIGAKPSVAATFATTSAATPAAKKPKAGKAAVAAAPTVAAAPAAAAKKASRRAKAAAPETAAAPAAARG